MFRYLVTSFLISLAGLYFSFGASAQTLIVQASAFRNNSGKARVMLFNQSNGYPTNPKLAYRIIEVPISKNKVMATFENLPKGEYAVAVHHDINGNRKFDFNLLGESEGGGASNSAQQSTFGPPSFEKAKFDLTSERRIVLVKINYMK